MAETDEACSVDSHLSASDEDDTDRFNPAENVLVAGNDDTGSRTHLHQGVSGVFLPDRYFAETAAFPYLQLRSQTNLLPPPCHSAMPYIPARHDDKRDTFHFSSAPLPGRSQIDWSSCEELVKPVYRDGDLCFDIECGDNRAVMYLSKLCQGSKGPCILFEGSWLTPNEFQYVSGRETAKDWKRSIRHNGKSIKLLLSKGILSTHPPLCDCEGCRVSSPVVRTFS